MLKFHDPIELTSVPTHPLADATIRRGTIRAMHFSTNEQLLVLGGRGIDLYEPETVEALGLKYYAIGRGRT